MLVLMSQKEMILESESESFWDCIHTKGDELLLLLCYLMCLGIQVCEHFAMLSLY